MKKMGRKAGSIIWLLIIVGGVVGWAKANNINDPVEFYDYFKSWSDKTGDCYGDAKELWNCDQPPTSNPTAGPSDTPSPGGLDPNGNPIEQNFDTLIARLKTVPTEGTAGVKYERSEWRHWSDLDRNGCDTRDDVLNKQGTKIVLKPGSKCDPLSGEWLSSYDGDKFTDPTKLDIDHVIPLGYASTHGAASWPAEKKEAYANDLSQLMAVSAHENRKKSDKGPAAYMPPVKTYWCAYSTIWVNTAAKYGLWLNPADVKTLETGLASC